MHICIVMPSGNIYPIKRDYRGSLHPEKVLHTLKGVPLDTLTERDVAPEDVEGWGTQPIRVMVEVHPDGLATECPAVRGDGWGHALQDSSVEDTLRELLASEKGTDKHEELMRKFLGEGGEKVLLTVLSRDFYDFRTSMLKQVAALKQDLADAKARYEGKLAKMLSALSDPQAFDDECGHEDDL